MESRHREVLRRRHYDLVKDLDVVHVVDQLIQDGIISIDVDCDIIAAESTRRSKAKRLLCMIQSRGPKAYNSFLEALRPNYKHLEENLKTCEQEILDEWKEKVKILLPKEYKECTEQEALTTLKDIHAFVSDKNKIELHDNELVKVINDVFGSSVFKEGDSSNSTQLYLKRKHQPVMKDSEGYRCKLMRDWTVSDLRFWLKSIGIPEEVVEWFYYENWGGDAIRNVTVAYLESKEILYLKSGDIFRIIQRRDDVLESAKHSTGQSAISASSPVSVTQGTQPTVSAPVQDTLLPKGNEQEQCSDGGSSEDDRCRMFGSSDTTGKLYKHDEVLPYTEGKQDQLTEASHLFVDVDLSTPDGLYQFAYETLQFACACLNDRTNGTIHFGVATQRTGALRPGAVIGTKLIKRDNYTKYLRNAVVRCFTREQQAVVSSCVQDPTFIKVDGPKKDADEYIVEVHVIPSYISCRDEAFFVQLPRSKPNKRESLELEKPAVFRWNHDKPSRVAGDELDSFMKSKRSLANTRKQEEQKQRQAESGVAETLSKKLVRLLCHGEDDFKGESYPILVINKPDKHMDQSFLQNTMSFLNKIQWKAVFDFDAEATMCKFFDSQEERMSRIVMTDDFYPDSAKNVKNPGQLETLKDGIRTSSRCPWIFSNGHNDTRNNHLDPVTWNKEKRIGFRKAVDFFASEIPKGRAMIVYLMLSNECDVMLEAAQDFHTMFPDQYMCVTENEDTWRPWKHELVHRKCESAEILEERAVIGISWTQVNQTIEMLNGPKRQGECRLPSSSGTYVTIRPHILQRLENLEVLSANQCENSEILEDEDACERHRLETEKLFYQGNKADWWNFYFSDHVLRRDKQDELSRAVNFELEELSTDRSHVHTVKMVHQPGSGGTTSAMQTLWEFRKKYRCAVVTKITNDTARQILDLRSYDDTNPRPVLLLLDNADEEYVPDLKMELEIQSRRMTLGAHEKPKVTCVFLECVRSTKIKGKYISLKQELGEEERQWFEKTNSRLEKTYSENNGVHPKLLISFNIMRKNFDPAYIKAKVKEVIGDIDSYKEKTLLKYVALINAYEVGFDPLPTAAFDVLMNDKPLRRHGKYNTLWETQMSSALGILINEVSNETTGYTRSLRMASPLLSKHVLEELRQQEDGTEQSLSGLVLEFFNDNHMFKQRSQSKKTLSDIVKTMLVRRERLHDGSQIESFAPLIQTICDDESLGEACVVIELGYRLIEDAFIAQQISRLHIKTQNWQQALFYAKLSTDKISSNSYLWDTYGRVYLLQVEQGLQLQYSKKKGVGNNRMEDVGCIVEIAMKGIDKFQKGQKATENEKCYNEAVCLNELNLAMKFLAYLNKTGVLGDKDHMRKCLTGESEMPTSMFFLEDFNGEDYSSKLKKMYSDILKTIVFLDDRNLQISHTTFDAQSLRHREQLGHLKRKFYNYFIEPVAKDCTRRSANELSQYRRFRLYAYQSYALGNIFDHEQTELLKMKKLVQENVGNASGSPDDLRVLISVNLVLSVRFQHNESTSMYDSMAQYSCKLYEQRHKLPLMYLEAYLFYVMFNWPRDNVKSLVCPQVLEESLSQWREEFFRKYPKAKDAKTFYRNRPTTKFFLANGRGMKSIFCYKKTERKKDEEFWRTPEVLQKLQRFRGILIDDGCYVQLGHDKDERGSIKIPTSFPIRYEHMWNKPVFFVVGFSWDGPKAFDVDNENPAAQSQGSTSV